jgi:hypothetical protein
MSVHQLKVAAIAAVAVAAVLSVSQARADEAAPANPAPADAAAPAPELQNAVEYFVTRPVRFSRDPSRGHMAYETTTFTMGTSFSYVGASEPNAYEVINETHMTLAKSFQMFGGRYAAELDVVRVGDVDDQFTPLAWNYEGSLNRNFKLGNLTFQGSAFVRYFDGDSVGGGDIESWSPGFTLMMPFELCDGGIAARQPHARNVHSANDSDKFLPSVSVAEVFSREISGNAGRDWEAEGSLGWEHPLGRDMSFGLTGKVNYFHATEDSVYSERFSIIKRFDQTLSMEFFILAEQGRFHADQHAKIIGVAIDLDF